TTQHEASGGLVSKTSGGVTRRAELSIPLSRVMSASPFGKAAIDKIDTSKGYCAAQELAWGKRLVEQWHGEKRRQYRLCQQRRRDNGGGHLTQHIVDRQPTRCLRNQAQEQQHNPGLCREAPERLRRGKVEGQQHDGTCQARYPE